MADRQSNYLHPREYDWLVSFLKIHYVQNDLNLCKEGVKSEFHFESFNISIDNVFN